MHCLPNKKKKLKSKNFEIIITFWFTLSFYFV
jgi:hypothetical protein